MTGNLALTNIFVNAGVLMLWYLTQAGIASFEVAQG
jgi:hypothetical protein